MRPIVLLWCGWQGWSMISKGNFSSKPVCPTGTFVNSLLVYDKKEMDAIISKMDDAI